MTEFTEPVWIIGDLGALQSAPGGAIVLPEPTGGNALGPSGLFGGYSQFDMRYSFLKDLVTGFAGRIPSFLQGERALALQGIPIARAANFNNIVTAQPTTSGTAMTLPSAAAQGIAINIPIVPFTGVLGSLGTGTSVTTAPVVFDFGFAWAATTANNSAVTVTDSTLFRVGDPLCIAHAGATATAALLTSVVSIASGTVVNVSVNPGVTATQTPVGHGFPWGPSEFASTGSNSPYPVPTSAMPYVAFGPGLFMDPRQSIARGLAITSAQSASTGSITIAGWDVFWQPVTDTITITSSTAAGVTVAYTTKTFKAINSITPNFTDAHNWTVGTSDVYGFPWKTDLAELSTIWWNGTQAVSTAGFTAPDFTSPASAITGDVRGTIQLGTAGSLTNGYAGGSSNGTVSSGSLTVTGSRLVVFAALSTWNQLNARLTAPQWQTGRPQV